MRPSASPLGTPFSTPFNLPTFGQRRPPEWSNVVSWHKGSIYNALYLRDFAQIAGDFPFIMTGGPCITLDGGSAKGTTSTDHGTIVSYEGTSTLAYDGTDLTGSAGTFYNLLFSDGTFFPCIGKTATLNPTTIYATNGSSMVLTGTPAALHAGTQNTYFYENKFGYWEDVSGRYPYAHSGATAHTANTWNNAITTYSFSAIGTPAPSAIVTMDAVLQVFTDGSGDSVGVTQAVLEALDNDQYFFSTAKGLTCYSNVLTDPELGKVLLYYDKASIITSNGVPITFNDAKIYVRT